jgi:hypothetical protein
MVWGKPFFCSFLPLPVGPDHHSAKQVLILTMKLWKMKMNWPGPLCSPLVKKPQNILSR